MFCEASAMLISYFAFDISDITHMLLCHVSYTKKKNKHKMYQGACVNLCACVSTLFFIHIKSMMNCIFSDKYVHDFLKKSEFK